MDPASAAMDKKLRQPQPAAKGHSQDNNKGIYHRCIV